MPARIKSKKQQEGEWRGGESKPTEQKGGGQQTARCEKDRRLGHPLRRGIWVGAQDLLCFWKLFS